MTLIDKISDVNKYLSNIGNPQNPFIKEFLEFMYASQILNNSHLNMSETIKNI